jgi:hypothetical protein
MIEGGAWCIIPRMIGGGRSGTGEFGSRHALALVALFVALLAGLVLGGKSALANPYDAEELQILQLINEYRQNNGLEPLLISDTLTVPSERHNEDMAKYGFFAHDTVASSYYPAGSEPWDRMAAEGYDYNTYRGENLAVGYETAEEAFEAWRLSPSHNAAMLDGNYKVVGIARLYVPGSEYGWYWTTDFGGVVDPSSHAAGDPPLSQDKPPAPEARQPETAKPEPPADRGGIENGAMQSEAVWRQRAKDGAGLILEGGRARLGDYDEGRDDLWQKIRVQDGAKLSYRLKVESEDDRRPFDRMFVRLKNGEGKSRAILKIHDSEDAGGWRRETLDLSRFAGETVYLSFLATTDDSRLTTFYVDDVSLKN